MVGIHDENDQLNTYTSHLPRDIAIRYGQEAVYIGESGSYLSPSDRSIDLKAEIDSAVSNTVSYPPDQSLPQSVIGEYNTRIEVTNETTLSAAVRQSQQGFKSVVLNFASATSPVGERLYALGRSRISIPFQSMA
jgi:uncharacterized protein (TIGR02452 family)